MITANLHFSHSLEVHKHITILPLMGKHQLKPMGVDGQPLKARVNHGRWIVDCECLGAEFAWEEGIFMCLSCFNASHKHQYRPVIFPKNRKAIELLLLPRPVPYRNWYPGESLAKLKAENEQHKAELLEVN